MIMAGIMNTLWDESSELEDEMLTPHPILSDDYTAHDMTKLDETIEKAEENEKIIEESLMWFLVLWVVGGGLGVVGAGGFFALCSTL